MTEIIIPAGQVQSGDRIKTSDGQTHEVRVVTQGVDKGSVRLIWACCPGVTLGVTEEVTWIKPCYHDSGMCICDQDCIQCRGYGMVTVKDGVDTCPACLGSGSK